MAAPNRFAAITLGGLVWTGLTLTAPTQHATAATITLLTTRPAFESAMGTTPLTLEDFTNALHFPISTGVLNDKTNLVVASGTPIRPGDIQPGVTYSTPIAPGNFFNIDNGARFDGGFLDGIHAPGDHPARRLTATFHAPVKGFGFDTNTVVMGPNFNININFISGPDFNQTVTLTSNNTLFFGFTSDRNDILSASLAAAPTQTTFAFGLDNFTFGDDPVPTVPEPLSATLLTAALAALATRRGAHHPSCPSHV